MDLSPRNSSRDSKTPHAYHHLDRSMSQTSVLNSLVSSQSPVLGCRLLSPSSQFHPRHFRPDLPSFLLQLNPFRKPLSHAIFATVISSQVSPKVGRCLTNNITSVLFYLACCLPRHYSVPSISSEQNIPFLLLFFFGPRVRRHRRRYCT